MRLVHDLTPPPLPPFGLGLDLSLSAEEEAMRASLADFALGVMEPVCARLDALPPDAVAAEGSEWWELFAAFMGFGIDVDAIYLGEDEAAGNRLKSIAFEELGRGDAGFATGIMVAFFPYVMCRLLGRDDLAAEARGQVGCWIATQGGRGSDAGDVRGANMAPGQRHGHPQAGRR